LRGGLALRDEKTGSGILLKKLVAIIDRNTANAVQFLRVPGHAGVKGNKRADEVAKDGSRQNQSQADIDMGAALHHLWQFTIQSWYNEFEKMAQNKPNGTANWQLRCCSGQPACTGLPPLSTTICCRRSAIFGHLARLGDEVPAHKALNSCVRLSQGRLPDPTWKRRRGRPRGRWLDQL